ncbi:MAG: glycine oxidase ThiO [Acidobacteriota bacterium]
MPRFSADVLIAGAGVIGCSIAYHLALRGAKVEVFDKGSIGREASWAGAGILGPQSESDQAGPFLEICLRSRRSYPALAARLLEETGIDIEYETTGVLYVMESEAERRDLEQRARWQQAEHLAVEILSAEEARKREPRLTSRIQGALHFPEDHQVHSPRLVEALAAAARSRGVLFHEHCEVARVEAQSGQVDITTSADRHSTRYLVLAAGAWSGRIPGIAAQFVPVEPVRGQIAVIKTEPGFLRHVLYCHEGYLVPRCGGTILIGSTSERVGFNKSVTQEAVDSLQAMARRLLPDLQDAPLATSCAGLRPAGPDAFPILGPIPTQPRVIVATGHFRNGILLAPLTGELIAGGILGGRFDPSINPFLPRLSPYEGSGVRGQGPGNES